LSNKLKFSPTTPDHRQPSKLLPAMAVPEEFDNQILSKAFIMWLEDIKLAPLVVYIARKIRMFKFIKSEYLEIANQMRLL
jgi:hypothetical protein